MNERDARLIDEAPLDARLRALAARGSLRRYRKDALLIQEGDTGDTLYIVLSGRLRSFSQDLQGREITYAIVGPGQFVGEMSLDGGPRCASVTAIEDTVCAAVDRDTLQRFIAIEPAFAFELLAVVIGRARRATESTRALALMDVYERIVQLIDATAEPADDGARIVRERLTHQEMANRIGASREMVSRIMKDLSTGGYVEPVGKGLVVRRVLPPSW